MRGQVFPVIQQSGDEILIQLSNGQQYFIPHDWTDQAPSPVCLSGACFMLEHLLTLCQRVAVLSHKNRNVGTIPSQSNRLAEGDRYGITDPAYMDPAFPGTARPGDRSVGANDPAAMEPAEQGETR